MTSVKADWAKTTVETLSEIVISIPNIQYVSNWITLFSMIAPNKKDKHSNCLTI